MFSRLTAARQRQMLFAAALLIAVVAALPLWRNGALLNTRGGGDSPFLLQRLHQLVAALRDGHFPVRWMPDANYGYGYPFYNYYAPLSVYIAGAFRLLGFSFTRSIQLAQLAGFLTAAWGVFLLAERWWRSPHAAFVASAAYTLAPFHMVNVYVRGDSLAEFWAMALYPLVLLGADRLLVVDPADATSASAGQQKVDRGSEWRQAALLALSYAALVLSHNISALIFTPFLLLLVFVRLLYGARLRALPYLAAAGLVGLALSAWFWLPALLEKDLVQLGPVTEGYFHYAGHFRGTDLLQRSQLFDYRIDGEGDPFRVGLVHGLLSAAGVGAMLIGIRRGRGRDDTAWRLFVLLLLLLATLMIMPLSDWLWRHVPLLAFTQFPWRFLSLQALAAALAIGGLPLLVKGVRLQTAAAGGIALLLLVVGLGDLQTDFIAIGDDDVSALRLAQYEWFSGNIGTTVSAEYLPLTVAQRPWTSSWLNSDDRDRVQRVAGEAQAERTEMRAAAQTWRIDVESKAATIDLPLLYFAGWRSDQVETTAAPGSGLTRLTLAEGEHLITVRLVRTPVRQLAELLSLVAVLLLALPAWRIVWGARRRVAALSGLLLLLGVLLRLLPTAAAPAAAASWDFAQLGYLHAQPVAFSNGARLLNYSYSAETVTAGGTLTVTLQWDDRVGGGELALVTPAHHRADPQPTAIARADLTAVTVQQVVLRIDDNAAAALYVPQLTLFDAAALTSSGGRRGALFLRPLRVTAAADGVEEDSAAIVVEDAILLALRGAHWSAPNVLELDVAWRTEEAAALPFDAMASWRIYDRLGRFYAQLDAQPGYGYTPTSLWQPGIWQNDRPALRWLAADGVAPFTLVASLRSAEKTIWQQRVAQLTVDEQRIEIAPVEPLQRLPQTAQAVEAGFGDGIVLEGYSLARYKGTLYITLFWNSKKSQKNRYTHFVHLVDRTSGAVVAQHDTEPQFGTYPTDQWRPNTIVEDVAALALDDVAPGAYQLVVGLYRSDDSTFVRLPLTSGAGEPDAFVLPEIIDIGTGP